MAIKMSHVAHKPDQIRLISILYTTLMRTDRGYVLSKGHSVHLVLKYFSLHLKKKLRK